MVLYLLYIGIKVEIAQAVVYCYFAISWLDRLSGGSAGASPGFRPLDSCQ
jgi:hypothetical protein